MAKVISVSAAVLIVSLIICFAWRSIEENRKSQAELDHSYAELDQTINNIGTGRVNEDDGFSYDMPLPARQPILVSIGLAVGVFVIGLLVIIASNSTSRSSPA